MSGGLVPIFSLCYWLNTCSSVCMAAGSTIRYQGYTLHPHADDVAGIDVFIYLACSDYRSLTILGHSPEDTWITFSLLPIRFASIIRNHWRSGARRIHRLILKLGRKISVFREKHWHVFSICPGGGTSQRPHHKTVRVFAAVASCCGDIKYGTNFSPLAITWKVDRPPRTTAGVTCLEFDKVK